MLRSGSKQVTAVLYALFAGSVTRLTALYVSGRMKLTSRLSGAADSCTLLDLPPHLLYLVTKRLDVKSQRRLFLSCAQLYQRWRLIIPKDDQVWQLVQHGTQLLVEHAGACDILSRVFIHPATSRGVTVRLKATVCYDPLKPTFLYSQSEPVMLDAPPRPRVVSQEGLWHRLSGKPSVANSSLKVQSEPTADWTSLKSLAKQLYKLLQCNEGFLVLCSKSFGTLEDFGIKGTAKQRGDRDCVLIITHVSMLWSIDKVALIVSRPKIDFDRMPTQITKVRAHLWTLGTPERVWSNDFWDTQDLSYYNTKCPIKTTFVYSGNVVPHAALRPRRHSEV